MNPAKKEPITTLELNELLFQLIDQQPSTGVRIRLLGQLWQQSFMKIKTLDDAGLTLVDEAKGVRIHVTSLDNIMQFEIDQRFQAYQPHFHYDVSPGKEV